MTIKSIPVSFEIIPILQQDQINLILNPVWLQWLKNQKAQVAQELLDLAAIGSMDPQEFARQRGRVEGQLIAYQDLINQHELSTSEIEQQLKELRDSNNSSI